MYLRELTQTVGILKGAGGVISGKLEKAGIAAVDALLLHYPRQDKYEDHITRRALDSVFPPAGGAFGGAFSVQSEQNESREVCAVVRVTGISSIYIHKKAVPRILVSDGTAAASLLCFRNSELARSLVPGIPYLLWGNFTYSEKYRTIQSSDFEIEREDAPQEALTKKHFGAILPVYRLTEGLRQWHFRSLIQNALARFGAELENTIPEPLIQKHALMPVPNAIRAIHFPRSFDEQKQARLTLIYEELFYLELAAALKKGGAKPLSPAPDFSPLQKRLLERLPFALTEGQTAALLEINAGLASGQPMARLLQGDVGSGKTLVSFMAALAVIETGAQAALLAPTELLAFQHAQNAASLLEPLGIRAAFLTGNLKNAGRKYLLASLAAGEIDLVIGTHALFSADVAYKNLKFVIIDEQHRFGVAQRQAILDKGANGAEGAEGAQPHLLMMSATPIPRTLAQTVFGAMDVSALKGMPPGRKPVATRAFSSANEDKVYALVRNELKAGRQAYFVYPLIGGGQDEAGLFDEGADETADEGAGRGTMEESGLKDAQGMARRLSEEIFPEYKTALLHSKLEDEEKKRIMEAFRRNEIQILAATSVVEVGVDVPNATCMVVEHAERFGLSALHQLRGRVGRGDAPSTCFLVWTNPPVPIAREADGGKLEIWQKRLKVMLETNDGFVIAEEDLKLRGPGQIAGIEQSGYLALGIANIIRDAAVLEKAREDAFALVAADPRLEAPANGMVAAVLKRAPPFTGPQW